MPAIETRHFQLTRVRAFFAWPAALLLIFWSIAILLQISTGAHTSEFGDEDPDAPAHYVTGLMIRDYLAQDFPGSPLPFAKEYYLHYPKVALGAWPPVFHSIEAIWMLLFSPSRGAVLALMSLITALTATSVFVVGRRVLGTALAFAAALVFVLMPLVQTSSMSVMVDGLVALLDFWAMAHFAKYLETDRPREAYYFAGIASLSALTKVNGLALLLLPLFAALFNRRWRFLKRKEMLISFLIVVLAAAPWNYFLWRFVSNWVGMARFHWSSGIEPVLSYTRLLFTSLGLGVASVFLVGVWAKMLVGKESEHPTFWRTAGALIAAVVVFHCLVPDTNRQVQRYLLPCLPPALLVAAAGFAWIETRLEAVLPNRAMRVTPLALVLALLFFALHFQIPKRHALGFSAIGDRFARESEPQTILVSAESAGEGMLIAEIAMRDRRPRHFVLRASKVLARSDWNGNGYVPVYRAPQQVSEFLDSVPVNYVVVDMRHAFGERMHYGLLLDALQSNPRRWRLAGIYSADKKIARPPILLYERIGDKHLTRVKFKIDMKYSLDGAFEEKSTGAR